MGVDISRYRKRIQKEFEVEVVTPMFMGSANINEAELRTPSLKGMLRFWWRATCGIGDIQELKKGKVRFLVIPLRKPFFQSSSKILEMSKGY